MTEITRMKSSFFFTWSIFNMLMYDNTFAQNDSANKAFESSFRSQFSIIKQLYPGKKYTLYSDNEKRHAVVDGNIPDSNTLTTEKYLYISVIDLDKLSNYASNKDPSTIIKELHQMIIPLTDVITNKLVNTIIMDSSRKGWRGWGTGQEKETIDKIRTLKIDIPDKYRLLKLGEFNLNFLSYYKDKELFLIPVEGDPKKGLIKGKPVRAAFLLSKYIDDARKYLKPR